MCSIIFSLEGSGRGSVTGFEGPGKIERIGITAGKGRIFDGKTQHGSSDSSRGIGIGLSICKSIILAHDGKIFAKNNLNGGASFTFVLPMKGESDYAQ